MTTSHFRNLVKYYLELACNVALVVAIFAATIGVVSKVDLSVKVKVAEAGSPVLTLTPNQDVSLAPNQTFQFAALWDTNGSDPGGVFDVSYDNGAVWSVTDSLSGNNFYINDGYLTTPDNSWSDGGVVRVTFQGQTADTPFSIMSNPGPFGYACIVGLVNTTTVTNRAPVGATGYGTSWDWEFVPPVPNLGGGRAEWTVGSDPEGHIITTNHPDSIPNTPGPGNYWGYNVSPNATYGVKLLPVTGYGDGDEFTGTLQCNNIGINVEAPEYVGGPGFTCSVAQSSGTVDAGGTTSFTINTQSSGGFSGNINFTASISPNPTNAPTITFDATNGRPVPGPTFATVNTTGSTPATPYTITFTGTSGSTSNTCTVPLTVNPAAGDFELVIQPSTGILPNTNPNRSNIGQNVTFTVFAQCTGGFAGPITSMTAGTTFSGVGTSLGTTTLNCGGTTTLTLSNTGSIPAEQQSTIINILSEAVTVSGRGQL